MAKGRFLVHCTVLATLIAASSCSSPSSESADTETVQPEDETETVQPDSDVAGLGDLPPAEGRTAFAVSDNAVIIGGGADRGKLLEDNVYRYNAIHDVWLLDESGEPTPLPPLDTDGIVQGFSGVKIDDTIVVGGMDCLDKIIADFLSCQGRHLPVIWVLNQIDEEWQRHALPTDVTEGALWTDTPSGGGDMWILGQFNGQAHLSLTNDRVTRFIAFDLQGGSFEILGDGEPTPRDWVSAPYCLTTAGEIVQLRARPKEDNDVLGEYSSWNYRATEILAARLDQDGKWHTGPTKALIDLIGQEYAIVEPPDVSCLPDGSTLSLLSPTLTLEASEGDFTSTEDRIQPVLVEVDTQTLQVQEQPTVDELTSDPDNVSPGTATRVSETEWIIQMSGETLYTLTNGGELTHLDINDGVTGMDTFRSAFLYDGKLGTVNHTTGEVSVR